MFNITEYGALINEIRKQKNLTVNYLIKDIISKSQYYKFVSGTSQISILKFDMLLNRLSMEHEEFHYIYKHSYNETDTLFSNIRKNFQKNNVSQLEEIKIKLKETSKKTGNIKDYHLYILCNILIKRIKKDNNNIFELKIIKKYLLSIDEWAHYELSLLNNTMFIFDYETLNKIINILIKKTTKFNVYKKNDSDIIKILSNILIMKVHNKEYHDLDEIINFMMNYNVVTVDDKAMVYFWKTLNIYIKSQETKDLEKLNSFLDWLIEINMSELSHLYKNIIDNI